jgi:hypothetical protein
MIQMVLHFFVRTPRARRAFSALCASFAMLTVGVDASLADVPGQSPALAATPAAEASPGAEPTPGDAASPAPTSAAELDVFAGVLSDRQRKMLDRDPRCGDAGSAMSTFVTSDGKALQTGVDAMSALEKCAALPRVGGDWSDFRDYVITAAAAVAYAVGNAANDERLLRRAADDAAHVTGFDAGNVTVTTYVRDPRAVVHDNETGHGNMDGPAQSSERVVHDSRPVSVYAGSYGRAATAIARAANERLAEISTAHPQQH